MTCNYVSGQCPYITPCKDGCPVHPNSHAAAPKTPEQSEALINLLNDAPRLVPRYDDNVATTSGHADETLVEETKLARELDVALAAAGMMPTVARTIEVPDEYKVFADNTPAIERSGGNVFADIGLLDPMCPIQNISCIVASEDGDTCSVCPLQQAKAPSYLRQPPILSTDREERKNTPIYSGVLQYFPRAIAYVSKISKIGNDIHNPGEPLHWAKGKSQDHENCVARHLIEAGTWDESVSPPVRHSGYLAWRSLALLETELEAAEQGVSVEELKRMYREGEL
jgi:hypothetical protein